MYISDGRFPSPVRTPETQAFWNAANEGRLLFAHCETCDTSHAYPRRVCPFCLSTRVVWKDAAGTGTLHAFSLFRKGQPPYVSAWVMLDEGVAVLTNVTDCDTDQLRIGTAVRVVFKPAGSEQLVPVFTPV